jgi:hypothetical protein
VWWPGRTGSTGGDAVGQGHREDRGTPEAVGGGGTLGSGCNGMEAVLWEVMGAATCTRGFGERSATAAAQKFGRKRKEGRPPASPMTMGKSSGGNWCGQ